MILGNGGWFVVADGERYRVFRNIGTSTRPDLQVVDEKRLDNPKTNEQGTDRPGRNPDNALSRSAVSQTDWHRLEKERFGEHLARKLNNWSENQNFDLIVIAADPNTLGTMRKTYSKKLSQQIALEIPKDLTNEPVRDLTESLLSHRNTIPGTP